MKCPKLKFSTILLRTKKKKITGYLVDRKNPKCKACAVGVIALACGWKPRIEEEYTNSGKKRLYLANSTSAYSIVDECLSKKGSKITSNDIWHKNDNLSNWSFKKIALWLKENGL